MPRVQSRDTDTGAIGACLMAGGLAVERRAAVSGGGCSVAVVNSAGSWSADLDSSAGQIFPTPQHLPFLDGRHDGRHEGRHDGGREPELAGGRRPGHVPRRSAHRSRAMSRSASGIVRSAISASGGLGEPWFLDGVNAVRVGDWLFEVEVDDLGWIMTAYRIDDGQAAAVAVLAGEDDGNPVRALSGWVRNAAGPMAWKRVKPGLYRSGVYVVGHLDTGEWFAEGPGVDQCFDHKHDAQAACAAARCCTLDGVQRSQ